MNPEPNKTEPFVRHIWYPDDILEIIRMLVAYFKGNHRTKRLKVYQRALDRALLVLGCYTSKGENPKQSYHQLGKHWRARLETAGINPNTLEVVDPARWALVWEGLKLDGYWPDQVEEKYKNREFVPQYQALEPQVITIDPKKSRKRKDYTYEDQAATQYLSDSLRNHLNTAPPMDQFQRPRREGPGMQRRFRPEREMHFPEISTIEEFNAIKSIQPVSPEPAEEERKAKAERESEIKLLEQQIRYTGDQAQKKILEERLATLKRRR